MDRDEELRLLTVQWNDAWNSRDSSKLVDLFSDSGTYYEPALGSDPVPGRAGIVDAAKKTWADWPKAKFEAQTIIVDPPRVVLEWSSTAEHKSGKQVRLQGVDLLEWDGKKVAACRCYFDVHSRNQQLGQ
jgi:uncharacterized protein (TIGR02246 family)